ncbi:MAG: response regulator [Spirochaetes bacterium]|nr:response regulator [Spirochaetota bacterium]
MKKIFILEDNAIISMEMELSLKRYGMEIVGNSFSGEDALIFFSNLNGNPRPDFALVDIFLAGQMNGIEFAEHIMNKYQIPIIFISGNWDEMTKKKALILKPCAFLQKPIDYDDLIKIIQTKTES